jgi:hypothetical protein
MKKIFVASIAIAVSTFSQGTFAGAKVTSPVRLSNSTIQGSVGSTRNSGDYSQYLFCKSDGTLGYCAGASGGITKTCTTNDPKLLSSIQSIKGDSYVYIHFNNGICDNITLYHGSQFEPKVK